MALSCGFGGLQAGLPLIGALLPETVVKDLPARIRTYSLDHATRPMGNEGVAVRGDLLQALAAHAGLSVTGRHETGRRSN